LSYLIKILVKKLGVISATLKKVINTEIKLRKFIIFYKKLIADNLGT